MILMLGSGMIYGMGIWSLGKPFQVYLVLHVQMMLLLQIAWKFLEVPFSRTQALLERLMIGRWMSLPCFSACCIYG
jgi:hypothetical protein